MKKRLVTDFFQHGGAIRGQPPLSQNSGSHLPLVMLILLVTLVHQLLQYIAKNSLRLAREVS